MAEALQADFFSTKENNGDLKQQIADLGAGLNTKLDEQKKIIDRIAVVSEQILANTEHLTVLAKDTNKKLVQSLHS
jgi:methyl-accepting chemotaxis protein